MVEHIERQTKQKDAIRAALADCEEFISAQDLHRRLEDEGSKIGLATVYRQLNALADAGNAVGLSKRINLGSATSKRTPEGLADRIARTNRALTIMGVN